MKIKLHYLHRKHLHNKKINQLVNYFYLKFQLKFFSFKLDSTLPSIQSSSPPSSSFLTPTDQQQQQMTSSPNHENETAQFELCRTSPNQDESLPIPAIQSNVVDGLEQ